jgi:hypothetical protein
MGGVMGVCGIRLSPGRILVALIVGGREVNLSDVDNGEVNVSGIVGSGGRCGSVKDPGGACVIGMFHDAGICLTVCGAGCTYVP